MIRRRDFIAALGDAAAWPLAARAQQTALPVVSYVGPGSVDTRNPRYMVAFHAGLGEIGYVDSQNCSIGYYYLEGQFDRLPALMAELVRRRVAVIVTPGFPAAALAAKDATATVPIVFAVGDNPVRLGLVASLARPGGNLTGINFFSQGSSAKAAGLATRVDT
jgi:putative ABC transport system substrate-binding protein